MTTAIKITPTRTTFNGGQFDSDFQYLRATEDGARTTMLAGPSLAINYNATTWDRASWRFKCGSYVMVGAAASVAAPSDVSNTPTPVAL